MEKVEFGNAPFDPFQPRFMCCCGSIHVEKGTKIIGIIRLVLVILSILAYLGYPVEVSNKIFALVLLIIIASIVILLLVGIKKENHRYLLPYLILEGFAALHCFFMTIFMIVILLNMENEHLRKFFDDMKEAGMHLGNEKVDDSALLSSLGAYFILVGILFTWWFSVIYRCYKYFKELAEARERGAVVVSYYPPTSA